MYVSTIPDSPWKPQLHTASRIWPLETTRSGFSSRKRSSADSVAETGTGLPCRLTSWVSASSSTQPARSRLPGGLGDPPQAQQGVHPGRDLVDVEGLGDVVVAAQRQAPDLVLHRAPGREEEDGRVDPGGAEPAADLETVEVGQSHVEQDHVGRALGGRFHRLAAGSGGDHVEAQELQRHREHRGDARLVLHDQHTGLLGGNGHVHAGGHFLRAGSRPLSCTVVVRAEEERIMSFG